jgi:hypothetical protein
VDIKKAFAIGLFIEEVRWTGTLQLAVLILQRETKATAAVSATGFLVHVDANAVVGFSQILLFCRQ